MKNILLFIFIIISIISKSQNQYEYENLRLDRPDLPAYLIANVSDTIGIVFTIENVQKIDKNLEVLEYMESQQSQIDTTEFFFTSLVSDLETKIDIQKHKIMNLISQSLVKEGLITNLRSQMEEKNGTISRKDTEISNLNKIITNDKKEIKKQKFLKWVSIVGGVIAAVATGIISQSIGD